MDSLLSTIPVLNEDVYFLGQEDARYVFVPFSRTYARINGEMERLLRDCSGRSTLEEVIVAHGLQDQELEVFTQMARKGMISLGRSQAPVIKQPTHELPPKLFSRITLFPTYACNLACCYCYARGGDHPINMSPATAEAALDFFFDQLPEHSEPVSLAFHGGGEPTLAKTLLMNVSSDFRGRCDQLGRSSEVSIVSNGTFDPEILNWILEKRIGVNISLDGPPEIHDALRPYRNGKGSYTTIAENIRHLVAAGRSVAVRATVTADTVSHMGEIVSTCVDLGVSALQVEPCFAVGRCEDSGIREPDPDAFVHHFLEAYRLGLRQDLDVSYSGLRCIDHPREQFCGACGGSVAVTPEGFLTSCFEVLDPNDPAASEFFVGHIDLSTGQVALSSQRQMRLSARVTPNISKCSGCFLRHQCAGDCVVKAYRENGDIFSPVARRCSMACRINQQIIAWIADGVLEPRNRQAFDLYSY